MEKPSYTTSKRALWLSSMMAWLTILTLSAGAVYGSAQAVEFGRFAVPAMVVLITAILGIHRGFGSLDMRTLAALPRDQPAAQPEGRP